MGLAIFLMVFTIDFQADALPFMKDQEIYL